MRWACLVVLTACGDAAQRVETVDVVEVGEVADDVTVDALSPGSFRWDPAAVTTDDFFAYPWPSDLRTRDGRAELTSFRLDLAILPLLDWALREVEAGPPGFSPLASAYFGLTVDVDPATLTDASVLLVDLQRGTKLARTVQWNGPGGGYWPAQTLAVHPDYQLPPPAGTKLAAILTTAIRTRDGEALVAPSVLAHLDAASPEAENLRAVIPVLDDVGLAIADVLAVTVWTSADPLAELRSLAGWAHARPAPVASTWRLRERRPAFDIYEADMPLVEAFSGAPPFTSTFGEGRITLAADGGPATPTTTTVTITLTVPRAAAPADGFPLVLYGHGLGEGHDGFLRVAAAPLAARGVAVLGLDPPLQGARNTTGIADRDLIVQMSLLNILGGREILRQGVLDYLQLAALARDPGFIVPADVAPDAAAITFDATRIGFMGHSEGAQIGALLLPLEPAIGPAVLSEGGGGAAITMLSLVLEEIDVSAAVAEGLGVNPLVEVWGLGHPLVSVAIQPLLDPADPLHGARQIIHAPLPGGRAHDLVMLEGLQDALTPPPSIEALASAMGLPIAAPVLAEIAGLEVQSITPVTLPAAGNLDGRTGALLQVDEDHYIIYFNEPVRAQLFDFLASALAGDARVEPLPDPPRGR